MKNYFRDCELVYVCDTTVRTGLSTRVVYSLIEMSKVNVSFSASTVNERKAQVGFRILEDEKTLEVTVFDYAPVDFFLTSSLRTPKFFVKEFSYFLMPCHQHGLRINLLVQR